MPKIALLLVAACLLGFVVLCAGCASKEAEGPRFGPPPALTGQEQAGDASYYAGRMQQALEYYRQAEAAGADPASVAYRMGFALLAQRKWSQALQSFEKSIEHDPDLALAYEGAGLAAFHLGKWDAAMEYLQRTAELFPAHWPPYAYMSAIHRGRREYSAAQAYNRMALEASAEDFTLANATMLDAYNTAEDIRLVREKKKNAGAEDSSLPPAPEKPEVPPQKTAPKPAPAPETAENQASAEEPEHQQLYNKLNAMWEQDSDSQSSEPQPQAMQPLDGEVLVEVVDPSVLGGGKDIPENAPASADAPELPTQPETPATPADTHKPEPVTHTTGPYALLDSSYKSRAIAEARRKELRDKGLGSRIVEVDLGEKGVWLRVLIGSFDNMPEAVSFKEGLEEAFGLDGLVILPIEE